MKEGWPAWFTDGRGDFEPDNFGTTVKYICPDFESYSIPVQIWEDDKPLPPVPPPPPPSSRDDAVKHVDTTYFNSLIPQFAEMDYWGHDVDDIPNPEIIPNCRNEAGVFSTLQSVQGYATFTDSGPYSEAEEVVPLAGSNDVCDIGILTGDSVLFGGIWPVGSIMTSNQVLFAVKEVEFDMEFFYRCEDGSNVPIKLHNGDANSVGHCRVFVLLYGSGELKYKKGVAAAARWASGAIDVPGVATGISSGVSDTITFTRGETAIPDDPIDEMLQMVPTYGHISGVGQWNCWPHADLMVSLLGCHGIGSVRATMFGGISGPPSVYKRYHTQEQQWATFGLSFAGNGTELPKNPHFVWHALCRIIISGQPQYWDPTFGTSGLPAHFCLRPDSAIVVRTDVSEQSDDYYPAYPEIWNCGHPMEEEEEE